MSLKAELETWAAALKAYDEEDYDKALDQFSRIADSSKILFNMGLIYATLGEHELATEQFNAATSLDTYLAVAYFQCGVSNFLLGRYELSLKDFEEALLYLRGNQSINYEQLGLKFKLYSAEVLFNKGLSLIYLGSPDEGLKDLNDAKREKATEEHSVIDDAINDRGEGYTVFSIPVGVLYRPPESKIKNVKTKDYLGKAKLVAAADSTDAYTTFTGVTRLRQGVTPTGQRVERPNSDPTPERSVLPKPPSPGTGAGIARANTTRSVASGMGGPAGPNRALSVRKPNSPQNAIGGGPSPTRRANTPPGQDGSAPPPSKGSRLTDMYDDLIDGYAEEAPPVPPMPGSAGADGDGANKRIQAWARGAGGAPPPPPSGPFRQPSTRAPSMYSATSSRRRGSRRTQYGGQKAGSRAQSTYEEEEEGYVSGEYEEGGYELSKVRVKIHYLDDIRGMALDPQVSYDEFIDKVCRKFDKAFDGLIVRFRDEEGHQISMRDESDYELAIETARDSAKGRPEGKLEVWCEDR